MNLRWRPGTRVTATSPIVAASSTPAVSAHVTTRPGRARAPATPATPSVSPASSIRTSDRRMNMRRRASSAAVNQRSQTRRYPPAGSASTRKIASTRPLGEHQAAMRDVDALTSARSAVSCPWSHSTASPPETRSTVR